MAQPRCLRRTLSLGRRTLCDYLHFTRGGYTAAAERTMRLPDVLAARKQATPRPSWGAILIKAFALAARAYPEINRAYFSFPWGHLGEFQSQIASVIINRKIGDEEMIFLAPLVSPEDQSLLALDEHLRRYMEDPIENIRPFRQAVQIAHLPQTLRRLLWWVALNVLPRRRTRHFGTFGVTTMSPFGAKTLEVPTLWGSFLHYGVLSDSGELPVGLAFDHRVMDGAVVGYTLLAMEQALHHEILDELKTLRGTRAA